MAIRELHHDPEHIGVYGSGNQVKICYTAFDEELGEGDAPIVVNLALSKIQAEMLIYDLARAIDRPDLLGKN